MQVADAMMAVFNGLDDGQLRILATLPTRRKPRARGMGMSRHGRVRVRHEQPSEPQPVSRHELLKTAAEQEHNWAWGKEAN